MITRLRIQNYKALRDVTLDLTPIHVLIGPNDTGKTSILEAVAALSRSADHSLGDAFSGVWDGTQLVWHGNTEQTIELSSVLSDPPINVEYQLCCVFSTRGRKVSVVKESAITLHDGSGIDLGGVGTLTNVRRLGLKYAQSNPLENWTPRVAASTICSLLKDVQFYRWVPSMLSLPTAQDASRRFRMAPSGFGLALCLDDILGYDRNAFVSLEARFRQIFPDLISIKLLPESAYRAPVDQLPVPMLQKADGKGLHFEFGSFPSLVPASQVSDGTLLVLAYLSLLYLPKPPRFILVEEPENGIHPARLKEVLGILRELVHEQSHTQVIMTTHSPYVLDMFKPDEVTLCTKQPDGSIAVKRLSDSKKVTEQLDVFTLGEIWTAEGDEALAADAGPAEEPGP